jgi:DNA-binding NtrC family response regulator
MATILCVDDEPAALLILRTALDQAGHRCIAVTNVDAAFNVLGRGPVDLIITDDQMPDSTGLEFLGRLMAAGHDIPVIVTTSYGSVERAVAAMRAGAIDHIAKPVRPEQLSVVVDQALEFARLQRENAALRMEVRRLRDDHGVLGESPAMLRILELVRTVAPTRAAVLFQGESGTGKELLARAVHDLSDRSTGPFVAVSCAPIPESLVETMLFGRAGNAAGLKPVQSAFDRARGGTLLLDEVSALPAPLQERLLRVLQTQEYEPAGGGAMVRVDVRIISSTNRDLAEEAAQGRFREDLYYRLSVVPVRVPPLRERAEDIPRLAEHFAVRTAREIGKVFAGIDAEALARLAAYAWPGNVRELAHAVERAVIMFPGGVLGVGAFDPIIAERAAAAATEARNSVAGAPGAMVALRSLNIADAEAALIERALAVTRNNRTRAAELLGISVRTLRNKLNREVANGAD